MSRADVPDPPPDSAETAHAVDELLRQLFADTEYLGRLEAMVRRRKHLGDADTGPVIEAAVDEAVRQLRAGRTADDPQALVWWLAEKRAGALAKDRGEPLPWDDSLEAPPLDEVTEPELTHWRELVERIDQDRPRQVWRLLIEAIESGVDFLPAWEISERLGGVSEGAIHVAITRGRQQLQRMAEAEGLVRILDDGSVEIAYEDE